MNDNVTYKSDNFMFGNATFESQVLDIDNNVFMGFVILDVVQKCLESYKIDDVRMELIFSVILLEESFNFVSI